MSQATFYEQPCPTCSRRLRICVAYLGKRVACQHCRAEFVAADPAIGAAPEIDGDDLLRRANELLAELDCRQEEKPWMRIAAEAICAGS